MSDLAVGGVVAVTGAAGGIGKAVSRGLAGRGFEVVAVDRLKEPLRELVGELGAPHRCQALDLTALSELDDFAAGLAPDGNLVGLVHLAAVLRRRSSIDEITEEDWDVQLDTNLKATFFLDRAVANVLVRQGKGGAIVNFTSQAWMTGGFGGSVVYAASKGGIVSMTRGLARTLAPHNIRVNAVSPGFVDTEMMRGGMSDEQLSRSVDQVPLGRFATPEEVADAAIFLVGPESRYITGATVNVSGGQLMY